MTASKAQQALTAQRRAKALALRVAGATLDQIATALEYADRASVSKDIARALQRAQDEVEVQRAELLEVELTRLDNLQRALWSEALAGNVKAVMAVLAVIDRRCKLLGLEAPTQVNANLNHQTPLTEIELAGLVTQARAAEAAALAQLQAAAPALGPGAAQETEP
jgi:hypothetical protein